MYTFFEYRVQVSSQKPSGFRAFWNVDIFISTILFASRVKYINSNLTPHVSHENIVNTDKVMTDNHIYHTVLPTLVDEITLKESFHYSG